MDSSCIKSHLQEEKREFKLAKCPNDVDKRRNHVIPRQLQTHYSLGPTQNQANLEDRLSLLVSLLLLSFLYSTLHSLFVSIYLIIYTPYDTNNKIFKVPTELPTDGGLMVCSQLKPRQAAKQVGENPPSYYLIQGVSYDKIG